jgi:hypothetical protein
LSSPSAREAEPSPTEAAREAYHHTIRSLFPFHLEVWGLLGLVAFLEQCGRGGVAGSLPGGPQGDLNLGRAQLPEVLGWLGHHLTVVIVGSLVILTLAVGLIALVLWIGSRATFVYLDDVAHGRAELVRPWHLYAERAASFFAWRFGLALLLLACVVVLVLLGVLAAAGFARPGGSLGMVATVALLAFIPMFLVLLLASGLVSLAMRDFVAPLQVHSQEGCPQAARRLWRLVRLHPMAFFLYVVLKVVFGVVQGTILLASACVTCCCILVPVVTQTFLQPLFFFERAWSLCFLRQMGYDVARAKGPIV